MKRYLFLLLAVFVLSCKKDPELNPKTIQLTKVETFSYPNTSSNDFDYLAAHTDEFQPSTVDEYLYDSQARVVEMRHYSYGQLYNTYFVEYKGDNISKIDVKPFNSDYKEGYYTATFNWAGDSIVANELYSNGKVINILYKLDTNKLPIFKDYDRANVEKRYLKLTYDEHGNIKKVDDGSAVATEYEYDLTKFNPLACSYNMRMFSILSTFIPSMFLYNYPVSTNLVSRQGANQQWGDPDVVSLETNPIGFTTKIKRSSPFINYGKFVRRFYYK